MSDDATLLTELIDNAERAITRGILPDDGRALTMRDRLFQAYQRPCDGQRAIFRHALTLQEAILELAGARIVGAYDEQMVWAQIAGVILPRVRQDLGVAIENRRRQR